MPCHSAIVPKTLTASPDDTVESILKEIKKSKVTGAAVIDENGLLLGLFSMKILLESLIPVSIAMTGDIQIDVKVTAAPGVAKRLGNTKTLPVSEVMDRKPLTILPDAPLWEGVAQLTKKGSPLVVVDQNNKFHGLITYDSLLECLDSMEATDA